MTASTSRSLVVPAAVGMGVIGAILVGASMFGYGFTGQKGDGKEGQRVCDLEGTVSGLVHDDNLFGTGKYIADLAVMLDGTNCRVKQASGWALNVVDARVPTQSTIGGGHVEVYVKVYTGQELVGSNRFTITTEGSQVEKRFTKDLFFEELVQGKTYTVKVFHSWKDNPEDPALEETVTVG